MFEFIEGEIAGRTAARLIVDVRGVGYDLAVPLTATFPDKGRVRVYTHLVVREESHTLFGFPDREMRDLFRVLLSARGVGPVMALGILSGLSPADLVEAIGSNDSKPLVRIKGVGQKTADQILLDLRDKAANLRAQMASNGSPHAPLPSAGRIDPNVEDAVAALVSIGYSEKQARASVVRAALSVDTQDLEALVRAALAGA
ncbi:MAG: Holliday junction branch migration protein RuvA [Planctomycetes bacterium]|nr:Holliday junction branch migration protein RuvA [Planctomycetota bacterium]